MLHALHAQVARRRLWRDTVARGYGCTLGGLNYRFADLKDLLAKATPLRSGDVLAGIAAARPKSAWRRGWRLPTCRSRACCTKRSCRTRG
jgi:hypothetical protein